MNDHNDAHGNDEMVTKPAEKGGKERVDLEARVNAAQETWTTLSGCLRSVKDAASATKVGKALFNKMSIAELATLVSLVKVALMVFERAIESLEAIQLPMEKLMGSLDVLARSLESMDVACQQFARDMDSTTVPHLSTKETNAVLAQSEEAARGCLVWMDEFHREGISPLSHAEIDFEF